jgi:hypothetical protein
MPIQRHNAQPVVERAAVNVPDQPGAEVGEEGVDTQDTLFSHEESQSNEEEDTCMSYEEEDTCMPYEEEDTCMSYEEIHKTPCFPGSTRSSDSACI